ncbi:MAG: molybdenum cofactor guanylyltransferase [Elainella sp. C42_A2020_010]|nr:molybdenum cofactor guanylyltransferase [Elainella sp. C42_A2020_010]RNJ68032.1 MAG: molybdenum cofactor guanylyltransferase [Leptolyngbya sp. IPPAS B-1204]
MAQTKLQRINAIVLAGGLSSRMGQDKALIAIDGVPLLQRVCWVALQCVNSVYVVTPWVDRYRPLLQDFDPPIQLVQEVPLPNETISSTPTHGPLIGFLQGLSQIQAAPNDWVLLLACDLPNLSPEILQQWLSELPSTATTTIACLPRNPAGWWEPLCGFYRVGCRASLAAYVQNGGLSFQHWLANQTVEALPLTDFEMLFNCNTPEELRQVRGHLE